MTSLRRASRTASGKRHATAPHLAGVEFIPENGGGTGVRLRKAEGEEAVMGEGRSQRDKLLSIAEAGLMMPVGHERELARSPEASQIRAARALLNWSDSDLAKASGLTVAMVGKIQAGAVQPSPRSANALREAFSAAGVVLLPLGDGADEGLGVRLRKDRP